MCGEVCGDNRFELIEKYKKRLIEATNIEGSQDEMQVLDNILFRFWQMGWLDILEEHKKTDKALDKVLTQLIALMPKNVDAYIFYASDFRLYKDFNKTKKELLESIK